MNSFCSGSLEIKRLHSKENYWTGESANAEVMISHVSGGPERAVISGPTAPLIPTSTETAATIRAELYHLCCWEVSPPTPVPHPQGLFPNLPQPISDARLEPWGQAHSQVLPPIVGLQSLASAWDSSLAPVACYLVSITAHSLHCQSGTHDDDMFLLSAPCPVPHLVP